MCSRVMASILLDQPTLRGAARLELRFIDMGDRFLAAARLVLLSPLLLALWVAVLALSGRSPLIAHKRVGRNGSDLWLLKFRTMWLAGSGEALSSPLLIERIDDEFGPALKRRSDPRVASSFARFCRKVLRGDMSLIGPRPVTRAELSSIYGMSAALIVSVKPGLTGTWQISGRSRLTVDERRELDIDCVCRRTVVGYLATLVRTLPEVILGSHSW